MTTSNTNNNETTMNISSLPTTEYLYSLSFDKVGFKNTISLTHYQKMVSSMVLSTFQQNRLALLCVEYNALTGEQQRAQNEPHLSAEDDFAVFTDQDGYCIVQHDPTYTEFKILGFEAVQQTIRHML